MQTLARNSSSDSRRSITAARWALILAAMGVVIIMLVLPLVVIFAGALSEGWVAYRSAIVDPETWEAIKLTLLTAGIAVPLNTLFGIAAAWLVTKFEFPGRSLIVTVIDLPFSISPVVAGLMLVLIFGAQGWLGSWLEAHDLRVIFALPGIVLATVFITFPFVARELIPLMQSQGTDEEQAARLLGARGWQTFWRVTLPNIKWGLLYGVILCNARAVGEFGAVYVVSGNVSGQITLPLRVERVYYASAVSIVPALAVASLMALVAVITLFVKAVVEWKFKRELRESGVAESGANVG